MTPARLLAASAAALGIAGMFAVPVPAIAAPAPCATAGSFAAQSGAELIRLDMLAVRQDGGRVSDKGGGARPDGRAARRSSLGEPVLQPAAGAVLGDIAGEGPGGVLARKPAGPGSTDAGSAGVSTDRADLPAPRPTSGSEPDRGGDRKASVPKGPAQAAHGGHLPPVERTRAVRDVRVGEATSALLATAEPSAAAVTRMVNSLEKSKLSNPLIQQSPPANAKPERRATPAAEVGPLLLDAGSLTSHARSGCEATRAGTTLGAAAVLDTLVVVPEKVESVSTTALERRGPVASASMTARTIELLDGAVHIKMLRSPTLTTSMSAAGGEVRYTPAELEVSGEGIKKTILNAAGDSIEMTFGDRTESDAPPALDDMSVGPALPLPRIPGIPVLGAAEPESAPAQGAGSTVKISLGRVRQAAEGGAVAARVLAVKIGIRERGYRSNDGVTLDMDLGVLESATVAMKSGSGVSGAGGGLPVTGPRTGWLAPGGAGLLVAGAAAVALGVRRRRFSV